MSVARFAWATLCFNVAEVLWGAFVRDTGSGRAMTTSGLTAAAVLRDKSQRAKFTRRTTSGVALLMVAVLLLWGWRATSLGLG